MEEIDLFLVINLTNLDKFDSLSNGKSLVIFKGKWKPWGYSFSSSKIILISMFSFNPFTKLQLVIH